MDLSVESTVMINRAVDLATKLGAKLKIVHVIEPNISEDVSKEKHTVTEIFTDLLKPLGVPLANLFIEVGNVQESILSLAKNQNIDLIIIGSHGKKGRSPLLGSTAQAVLSRLKCDVLTLSVLNYPSFKV